MGVLGEFHDQVILFDEVHCTTSDLRRPRAAGRPALSPFYSMDICMSMPLTCTWRPHWRYGSLDLRRPGRNGPSRLGPTGLSYRRDAVAQDADRARGLVHPLDLGARLRDAGIPVPARVGSSERLRALPLQERPREMLRRFSSFAGGGERRAEPRRHGLGGVRPLRPTQRASAGPRPARRPAPRGTRFVQLVASRLLSVLPRSAPRLKSAPSVSGSGALARSPSNGLAGRGGLSWTSMSDVSPPHSRYR